MNCETYKDYIMKYFDGELNDLEETQLKQHIKSCSCCSDEFNALKDIMSALEQQTNIEPPPDFEIKVMAKVDEIEKKRREKNSRVLVLLYNAATLLSIVLLLIFVADMKQVSVLAAFEKINEYFNSFTTVTSAVFGVVHDILVLIGSAFNVVFSVALSIVKSYYYVFLALIIILFTIQKLLNYIGTQAGRETK